MTPLTPKLIPDLSLVEHHDAVRGEDGVEAVGDGKGGAVPEGAPDGLLYQGIHLWVHGCCGLVHNQDLQEQRGASGD